MGKQNIEMKNNSERSLNVSFCLNKRDCVNTYPREKNEIYIHVFCKIHLFMGCLVSGIHYLNYIHISLWLFGVWFLISGFLKKIRNNNELFQNQIYSLKVVA